MANPAIPRDFSSHPNCRAIHEADIPIRPSSRYRIKVLVFKSSKDLQHFWNKGLGRSRLGRHCRGVVSKLSVDVTHFSKDGSEVSWVEYDPRYVAIVGLLKNFLTCEYLSHEAVHVGFAWAERFGHKDWPDQENPEEKVCYPAGRFFAEVVHNLRKHNIVP